MQKTIPVCRAFSYDMVVDEMCRCVSPGPSSITCPDKTQSIGGWNVSSILLDEGCGFTKQDMIPIHSAISLSFFFFSPFMFFFFLSVGGGGVVQVLLSCKSLFHGVKYSKPCTLLCFLCILLNLLFYASRLCKAANLSLFVCSPGDMSIAIIVIRIWKINYIFLLMPCVHVWFKHWPLSPPPTFFLE